VSEFSNIAAFHRFAGLVRRDFHQCGVLFPSDRFIAFFAETLFGELPNNWLGRLAFKGPAPKRIRETPDRTTYRACCRPLTRMAENRPTSTACRRSDCRTPRHTCNRIFLGIFFVGRRLGPRSSVRDTFVDILLGHARPNTREIRIRRQHRLLRCTGSNKKQRQSKPSNPPTDLHDIDCVTVFERFKCSPTKKRDGR